MSSSSSGSSARASTLAAHRPPDNYDTFGAVDQGAVTARANASSRLRTGHVDFKSRDGGAFARFKLPKRAGRKTRAVRSDDGKHRATLQFINNDYVIITVPRQFAAGKISVSPSAPDKFKSWEFAGTLK